MVQDLDENWRHLALEIVVTTAETAPAMVRKVVGGSVGPLVQACLQMMCDLEVSSRQNLAERFTIRVQKFTLYIDAHNIQTRHI